MKWSHDITPWGVLVKFDEKPAENIRNALKSFGFRWSPGLGAWERRRVAGAADVIASLRRTIDGPEPPRKLPCWNCKADGAIMRNYAAQAPVLCEACWDKFLMAHDPHHPGYRAFHSLPPIGPMLSHR